jgi:vancomycin permeability regulator SanA
MKFLRRLFVSLALLYGLIVVAIEWLSQGIGTPLRALDKVGDVHRVAVVFYTDDPKTRNDRLLAAIEAFRDGKADILMMAGGDRPERGSSYNGAITMRQQAISLGVPEEQVLNDGGSNNTVSNLQSALMRLEERFNKPLQLALFTDRFQLLRLSLIAKMIDIKEPMVKQPVLFVEAGKLPQGTSRIGRLNHEILAYLSLLLPPALTKSILAQTRRS